jgi:antitoxin component YwqK of YwqJK toxin-antitoxin module
MLKQVIICLLMVALAPVIRSQNTQPKADGKTYKRKLRTDELQNMNEVYYYNNKPYTGTTLDMFPDNKSRMQEIDWVNGLLDGTKTEYFPGGVLVRTIMHFKQGKRNGPFIYYHDNGKVKLRGKYVDDLLDSTLNSFYDNGNNKYIHHYNLGVKVGESITFFKNGNVEQKVNLKNEKPDGVMLTYYEAGNLRLECEYKEGVRNGKYLHYHLTGLLAEESYFKNGVQDSVSRYWDNVFGSLLKEQYYKMGKKEGTWLTFNQFGDTITIYNYRDDVLNGPYKKYVDENVKVGDRDNGKYEQFDPKKSTREYMHELDEYGTYVNGKLDGEFKTGLFNTENHAEGFYKNGIMVGEWKYYDKYGKLVLHEKYNDDGELIYQKPKLGE